MHPTRYPPGAVRCLSPDDIAAFVAEELFAAGRTQPVVALTTDPKLGRPLVDAVRVTTELRGLAEVVEIETGDATWALSDAMPPRLDVYGGAVRIWWPGLTAESGPRDHPLFFVYTDADARRVEQQVIAAVRDRDRARAGERSSPAAKAPASPVEVKVTVVSVDGDRIVVEGGGARGTVTEADLPLEVLAPCVTVGLELDARLLRPAGGSAGDGDGDSEGEGGAAFSLAGMLPNAWQRLGAEVREQDVLVGRVQNLDPQRKLVFVDVLPGAVGVCPIGELHHEFVRDMADYVEAGELLPFAVVSMDAKAMRLMLSRKRAFGEPTRPSPSLVPGGAPFVWTAGMPRFESLRRSAQRGDGDRTRVRVLGGAEGGGGAVAARLDEQVKQLEEELAAANAQRKNLVDEIRSLRQQVTAQKRDLRSANDRYEGLVRKGSGDVDPLSSERAFLQAVRVCYARTFEEQDRLDHPLRRMRVGPEFLRTVAELEGISVDKVVEVCAQVACGAAAAIPAREVHQLREGLKGAGGRVRASDDAKAWRCSLQDQTAGARRLHWWSVPGDDGGVVEWACVVVHDDYRIPE